MVAADAERGYGVVAGLVRGEESSIRHDETLEGFLVCAAGKYELEVLGVDSDEAVRQCSGVPGSEVFDVVEDGGAYLGRD